MKSIELTENHKSKLLKMCKKLFPEYKYIYFGINDDDDTFDGFIYFAKHKLPCDNIINIHWFEFCMTHLIVELSKEFTKQKLSKADYTNNQYPNWFSEELSYHLNPFRNKEFKKDILFIHPINYLYDQFKKLK